MKIKFIYAAVLLLLCNMAFGQSACSKKKYGTKELLGDYDYRSQSTFGKMSPGDTIRIKVVLYANNDVRIFAAGDEELGNVNMRILTTTREYKRQIDRIETNYTEEPIYKIEDGHKVPQYDDWGDIELDEFGDTLYEVASTKKIPFNDTIWKTVRVVKEDVVFDSEKGQNYYDESVKKTRSIIIEVVVPGGSSDDSQKHVEGCVGIMIGRQFHSGDYKRFSTKYID